MNIFIILLLEKINLYLLFYTFVLIIFTFIIKKHKNKKIKILDFRLFIFLK